MLEIGLILIQLLFSKAQEIFDQKPNVSQLKTYNQSQVQIFHDLSCKGFVVALKKLEKLFY